MHFDEFNDIHASEETKNKTLAYVMRKQKKHPYQKPALALLITSCLLLLFIFPSFLTRQSVKNNPVSSLDSISYISVDINPSMEWAINEKNIIIDVTSYNEDVKNLSFVTSLKGKTLMEGMNLMMQDTAFQEYMKEGFLEIGIYSEQKQQENKLEKQINDFLEERLSSSKYHCSCPNKDTFERSREQKISFGKYSVIQEILLYDSTYSETELKSKSMRELYDILALYDEDTSSKGKHHGKQKGKHHKQQSVQKR